LSSATVSAPDSMLSPTPQIMSTAPPFPPNQACSDLYLTCRT
jgi:hypothetical protein